MAAEDGREAGQRGNETGERGSETPEGGRETAEGRHEAEAAAPVRPARSEGETKTLSSLIAEAFLDLAPSVWLVPDAGSRRALFPAYFRLYVEHAFDQGIVETTPERDAVALWFPVGAEGLTAPRDYEENLASAVGPWLERFLAFDALLEKGHPGHASHHYLAILAVRPDRQRRGIGSALLDGHHRALEDGAWGDTRAAYLEASDAGTRTVYLRHGYVDHGEPIRFSDEVAMYPMWREPR